MKQRGSVPTVRSRKIYLISIRFCHRSPIRESGTPKHPQCAMLSEKRRGRHSKFGTIYFWCLLALFGSATFLSLMRWDENYPCLFSERCRSRLVRALSAPASLALLDQASYRRDGAVVHSDAGCFLRRQWKAASALEGPASFHVLANTHGRGIPLIVRALLLPPLARARAGNS